MKVLGLGFDMRPKKRHPAAGENDHRLRNCHLDVGTGACGIGLGVSLKGLQKALSLAALHPKSLGFRVWVLGFRV